MKQYIYSSDIACHFSLEADGGVKEISLYKDEAYDLPEDSPIVKRMVAQGLLKPVDSLDKGKNKNVQK